LFEELIAPYGMKLPVFRHRLPTPFTPKLSFTPCLFGTFKIYNSYIRPGKEFFPPLKLNGEVIMEAGYITLNMAPSGSTAKVKGLTSNGNIRRRMLDLGLVMNTDVEVLQKSPSGDPTAYHIRGAVIALRSEEASKILVEINPIV
jgi:ferrous iron transport protein A